MKMQKGFTLIELMIVMAVIGILAAVAFPAYKDYVMRGQIAEATAALSDGRIKAEQFYQDNHSYSNGGTTPWCPPDAKDFTMGCTSGTAPDIYTITATGQPGSNVDGFKYTINQDNAKTTVITNSTAGWGTGGACWITKKGGTC